MNYKITTNLDSIDVLTQKLSGKSNFQAFQACEIYVYFNKREENILPCPSMRLRVGNKTRGGFSTKEFLSSPFDAQLCAKEGLKSIKINDESEIASVYFDYIGRRGIRLWKTNYKKQSHYPKVL